MYENLKDKEKVVLRRRIKEIVQTDEGVEVVCTEGQRYKGDVVVGADGVNSVTRKEMWRSGDEGHPGYFEEKDKTSMSAEYQCLFGISKSVEGLDEAGRLDVTYEKHMSTMNIVMEPGRSFWFVFRKLDRVYKHDEIPKYTAEDAKQFMEDTKHINMEPNGSVTLDDTYKSSVSYTLVPLEEAQYEKWFYRRMVCIGDSIHKVTPNAGVGGNDAILSAAALANALRSMDKRRGIDRPSEAQIQHAFQEFQDTRKQPVQDQGKQANFVTRMQASKTFLHRWVATYLLAHSGDLPQDLQLEGVVNVPMLNYLPPPHRSLQGTASFNPSQGGKTREWRLTRLLLCLSFFLSFYLASRIITPDSILPSLLQISESRQYHHSPTNTTLSLLPSLFPFLSTLDATLLPATAAFLPSILGTNPLSRIQTLLFISDLSVVYALLLIESSRRSNAFTIAVLPCLLGLGGQLAGFGLVSSVFLALFWTRSQIQNFKARDMRLTSMKWTSTVLPAMVIGAIVPNWLQFFAPAGQQRHWWNWVWQVYPVNVGVVQWVLAHTVARDTVKEDRLRAPLRDLRCIAWTVGSLGAVSAGTWVWTVATMEFSLREVFVPVGLPGSQEGFEDIMRVWLQWDEVLSVGNVVLWVLYSFWDLKAAGMVTESWPSLVLLLGVGMVVVGPGAAIAAAWGYREWVLATRKHKGAITTTWKAEDGEKGGDAQRSGSCLPSTKRPR
ncbi:hypothetical protein KVT40_003562 [Elsinoe batatas]|uniref:FAD-binding domain-containing protein n=1 Tax=Elsinoe batatas TaxID=2601811 RepID=A0A8K0PJF3_9PEZI|nr:hypothetical protein KVT40_003562 [Elsinoe batatas]